MMTFWSWVILSSMSGTMVVVSTVRRVASAWSEWLHVLEAWLKDRRPAQWRILRIISGKEYKDTMTAFHDIL